MIRLVSWDVDGTLFSYSRLLIALFRLSPRKLETCGWLKMAGQIRNACRFHQKVEAQRRRNDSRVDVQELHSFESIQLEEKAALDAALRITRPRLAALDTLKAFRAEGVPQVVLSDFECDYKLKALGLTGFFERTYSCHTLGYWKPSALPFAHVQRDFGVRPDEHLHIGDRNNADGWGAARNGCRFINVRSLTKLTNRGFLRAGNVQSYSCETYRQDGL
jgi:FMN phosphatase YigB (HAD superfamily)